ncbi:MAG: hypothetical protein R6V19_12200 [Armatimonadota bacterium]
MYLLVAHGPVFADSPADLFWDLRPQALAEGGASVSGCVTGRAHVEDPITLPQASGTFARSTYSAQTPLVLERGSRNLGKWETNILRNELVVPGERLGADAWHIGVCTSDVKDTIWYRDDEKEYIGTIEEDARMLSAAYETGSGWVFGASYQKADTDASLSGASVAGHLEIDGSAGKWPRATADATRWKLGVAHQKERWHWGIERTWCDRSEELRVSYEGRTYGAPIDSTRTNTDAYVAHTSGDESWFLSGRWGNADNTASILAWLWGRADLDYDWNNRSLAVGWRHQEPRAMEQVVFDVRKLWFDGSGHGYAGFPPGIVSDAYALKTGGDLKVFSLRYGRSSPLRVPGAKPSDHWTFHCGSALSYCSADMLGRLRRVEGRGADPETLADHEMSGGILRVISVSVGAEYHDDDWNVLGTFTMAAGEANEAFDLADATAPEQPDAGGPTGPSNHLQAKYFFTLSALRRF